MKETVLLKLSGEALAKQGGTGIDMAKVQTIAYEIKALSELGVSIGVVIGAGNMWRGRDASTIGMDRITADQMGMIGTILNAMALYGAFESINVNAKVMTSIPVGNFTEPYNQKLARKSLEKGDIVLIIDETHGKPLAIGVSLITGEEMVENDSGKAVETKHYVGDEIWNFEL